MSEREIVKKYKKNELTVVWKPKLCIHSAICVKELPNVYDPKAKPWITPENASVAELKAQIAKCPSGALSYELENQIENNETIAMETKIEMRKNGPLLVHGNLEVTDTTGKTEKKERITAFCRCGASSNKPYCDGTHNSVGFEGWYKSAHMKSQDDKSEAIDLAKKSLIEDVTITGDLNLCFSNSTEVRPEYRE